jgi:predicted transcriptional regulator
MSDNSKRTKIAEYIASGYSQEDTAKIIGVEPATISGYLKDEGFQELVKELSAKPEFRQNRISAKYERLEEKTLNSLGKIAGNELTDVSDLCKILDAVGRNKKNGFQPANGITNPTLGITLVFPNNILPQIQLDEQNRVIEIGGQSMRPMSMHNVKGMFAELEENKKAIQGESKREEESKENYNEQRATA